MTKSSGSLVVHYSELGIKKKNKARYLGVLKRNLDQVLEGIAHRDIRHSSGRLVTDIMEPLTPELRTELVERVSPVQGMAHFAVAERIKERDLDVLDARVRAYAKAWVLDHPEGRTFRIQTARGDKAYRLTSVELNRRLGSVVAMDTGLKVQLKGPDLTIYVEILRTSFLVYAERHLGEVGLPVGTSARVLSLLSSGIDSPVASYRAMTRGCRVSFVHFHSLPYTSRASVDLARELATALNRYQPAAPLYLVPFAEIQREIVAKAPSPLRVVLYRRYMLRLAERVARRAKARALVTGDSVGQVASQTVENMSVIDLATDLLVLRPLIAMNKQDIIAAARSLNTYDISTQPYEDCCSYLMPESPETHATLEGVLAAEEAIGDLSELMFETLAKTEEVLLQPSRPDRKANPISL